MKNAFIIMVCFVVSVYSGAMWAAPGAKAKSSREVAPFTQEQISPWVPVITLYSPNGGETITNGSRQVVQWSASPGFSVVSIELSQDGGKTYQPIVQRLSFSSFVYDWVVNIAGPGSDQCLLKVRARDNVGHAIEDVSDGFFRVLNLQRRDGDHD